MTDKKYDTLSPEVSKIILPMIRQVMPSIIAKDLVKVQPMASSMGAIFNMNMGVDICEFCGQPDCALSDRVTEIHQHTYERFPESMIEDYYLIAWKSTSHVEAFFKNILIVEYKYEIPERINYFDHSEFKIYPSVFKENLYSLRYDLNHTNEVTEDRLADHGIYFYG